MHIRPPPSLSRIAERGGEENRSSKVCIESTRWRRACDRPRRVEILVERSKFSFKTFSLIKNIMPRAAGGPPRVQRHSGARSPCTAVGNGSPPRPRPLMVLRSRWAPATSVGRRAQPCGGVFDASGRRVRRLSDRYRAAESRDDPVCWVRVIKLNDCSDALSGYSARGRVTIGSSTSESRLIAIVRARLVAILVGVHVRVLPRRDAHG